MDKWEEYQNLLNEFDFYYIHSDDHNHWKKHVDISIRISKLYNELKRENEDVVQEMYTRAKNNMTIK